VSEKTVYNYFPTKESLLLDREPEIAETIWRALGPGSPVRSPVAAVLEALSTEREGWFEGWRPGDQAEFRLYAELIDATPALQAAMRDMTDRLERTAAEALAEKAGVSADEPEPRIAAGALIALWRIQFDALRRCAHEEKGAAETSDLIKAEVERAARVAESGLWWFGALAEGRPTRQQLKTAAEAAMVGGRQILGAIRQARTALEQMHREGDHDHRADSPLHGLADLIEETARLKRDVMTQRDDWKRAYREEQTRLRQAQRELARRYRQAGHQHHRELRGREGAPPWPLG
ncbi:MAG: hypothetical protein ACRDVW_01090, partial [Acidimicrobiales bacterium]